MNNTLVKGLSVLEKLARGGQPMGVSELAKASALPKSGVHRLLRALVEERYVEQESSGRYRVTTKLWGVASAALPGFDLRRHAEPLMQRLADHTGKDVLLSVLDRHEVVYLHKVEAASESQRAYSQIGGRVPAHCVATGKAMVAFSGPRCVSTMAERLGRATPNTVTEPRAFLAEMAQIRAQGYARNRGEWRTGVSGIASPVFDDAGAVVAAIGISGFSSRIDGRCHEAYAAMIIDAGQALSNVSRGVAGPHALLCSVTNHWSRGADDLAPFENRQLF